MNKRIAVVAAAALISCGGSSQWVDPTTGNFTTQDSADIMTMMSGALSQVQSQPGPAVQNALTLARPSDVTQAVNYSASCTPSGNVALTGSMNASCDATGACNFSGGLQLNLSSCANTNGLVGNGQINIGASGNTSSTSFKVHETVQGAITVTRNGAAVGTCGINVTIDVSSNGTTSSESITGTICKQPVQ